MRLQRLRTFSKSLRSIPATSKPSHWPIHWRTKTNEDELKFAEKSVDFQDFVALCHLLGRTMVGTLHRLSPTTAYLCPVLPDSSPSPALSAFLWELFPQWQ